MKLLEDCLELYNSFQLLHLRIPEELLSETNALIRPSYMALAWEDRQKTMHAQIKLVWPGFLDNDCLLFSSPGQLFSLR